MTCPDPAGRTRVHLHHTAPSGAASVAPRKGFNDAILSDRSFAALSIALFVIAILLLFASTSRAATARSFELSPADEWWQTAFFLDTSAHLTSAYTSQTQTTSPTILPPEPAAPTSTKTFDGGSSGNGTSLSQSQNWSPDGVPVTTDEALFTTIPAGPDTLTATGASLTFGDFLWNNNNSSTISINTNGSGNGSITLSGGGGSTAAIAAGGASGDLLLMGTNATSNTLTFTPNVGAGSGKLSLILGASGNFDVVNAGATLSIGVAITETGGARSVTKTGAGLLIYSGADANTYSGTTTVNSGELDLNKTAGVNAIAGNLVIGDGSGTDTVKLLAANQIIDTSDLTLNASGTPVFNLNGHSETIDALNSSNTSASVSLGSGTLTVGAGSETSAAFAGVISGSGGFAKTGSGLQLLSGANTYTGDTAINGGILMLAPAGSLASASTIRLGNNIANSPSAEFDFGSSTGGVTLSNALEVRPSSSGTQGERVILALGTSGNTNTYSGAITMNAGLTLQSAAVGGSVVNGPGIFLLQGGSINLGTSTLSVTTNLRGNGADTYSIQGTVWINEALTSTQATGGSIFKDGSGTLVIQSTGNNYTGTNSAALNANGTRIGGGVLAIYGDTSLGLAPSVATNNIFFTTSGVTQNVDSIAPTLRADANNITLASTRNINVASGVTGRFDSNGNTFTANGVVNGSGNVAKIGAGTLIFNGNNTYTGTTTVSAGTLLVNGIQSAATGAVTVNNNGTTLGGTGTIGGSVTVNSGANLAPGASTASTGILRTGALTLNSSSNFVLELNGTTAGSGYDQLRVTGSVTLNLANIVASVGGTINLNDKFFVMLNDGIDPVTGTFAQGATVTSGGYSFLINYLDNGDAGTIGNDISLTVTAVPEPSTWVGASLALVALLAHQRRRLKHLLKANS